MLNREIIKEYSKLLQKKYREEQNKFMVEGIKLVKELIYSSFFIETILVTHKFAEENEALLSWINKKKLVNFVISNKDFEKLSDTKTPQGIIAVVNTPPAITKIDRNTKHFIALENINDPGNLGTILRTCDWFGFANILISENSAELFNPKVIRSSAGSIFHELKINRCNLTEELKNLNESGYEILTTDINGENIYSYDFKERFVLVFSNESNGPSDELIRISSKLLMIPGNGKSESLNVAVSSAVFLSEVFRRK